MDLQNIFTNGNHNLGKKVQTLQYGQQMASLIVISQAQQYKTKKKDKPNKYHRRRKNMEENESTRTL